jgi:hypothetical protein
MKAIQFISAALLALPFSLMANNLVFPDIEGFEKTLREDVYDATNLYDLINGGSDAYIELNFMDLHLCEYKKGDATITVEAYNHGNLANAFGIYASERSTDYHFVDIGTEGYHEDGALNFFQGPYYIKINGYSPGGSDVNPLMPIVGKAVSASIQGEKKFPEWLSCFPEENKIPYTDAYVNNSFMGYGYLNNVFLNKYNIEGKEITLFAIVTESSDQAQNIMDAYLKNLNSGFNLLEGGMVHVEDQYAGTLYFQPKGRVLLGTVQLKPKHQAQELFAGFQMY